MITLKIDWFSTYAINYADSKIRSNLNIGDVIGNDTSTYVITLLLSFAIIAGMTILLSKRKNVSEHSSLKKVGYRLELTFLSNHRKD